MTQRTIQAHCTFLEPTDLDYLASCGTAVAHCPLSNAYFSKKPFRLREALQLKVRVGLGTDIAGGYSIDIMNAMRQAVIVSRMRDGELEGTGSAHLPIDWREALYLATRGGAVSLNIPTLKGMFEVGASFDAQHSMSFQMIFSQGFLISPSPRL